MQVRPLQELHLERHTSGFVLWVRGRGVEDFDEEEKKVLCQTSYLEDIFHIITIVFCVHFIPHYCVYS